EHARGLPPHRECLASNEVALVQLDSEAQPCLERRVLRRDVGTPDAVALLEPQGIDRPVSACNESMVRPGLPERVPEPEPILGRAVELPAELPDVRDTQRPAGNGTDRQLTRVHVRERVVRE